MTMRTYSSPEAFKQALEQNFSFRKTHPLPLSVPAPPPAWERPCAAMAREDQLAWATLAAVPLPNDSTDTRRNPA